MLKHKFYAGISILGLSVAMGISILIFHYVHFELSFDSFHENTENKYRVTFKNLKSKGSQSVHFGYALGNIAEERIAGIEDFTRIRTEDIGLIINSPEANVPYQEEGIWYVDPNFLEFFSLKLKHGKASTALDNPHDIVITQSMANKYFGHHDVLGKPLNINAGYISGNFIVSGVLDELPANTHLQMNFLLPLQFLMSSYTQYKNDDGWLFHDFITYFTIRENAHLQEIENQIDNLLAANPTSDASSSELALETALQPITDIHLYSDYEDESAKNNGDIRDVQFFLVITFFVLLMAWINHINLSTAQATVRAREVGVRKAIGAVRTQLIYQFMMESFLLNFIAAIVALIIAVISLPLLNQIINQDLSLDILSSMRFWSFFLLFIVVGTILSGLYPAFILSSFKALSVLKSIKNTTAKGFSLRRGLIAFQFMISILLIAGTYLIYKQMLFVKNKDLGFEAEQILVINGPRIAIREGREVLQSKLTAFKNQTKEYHAVLNASGMSSVPGKGYVYTLDARQLGAATSQKHEVDVVLADADFTDTYQLSFIAGKQLVAEQRRRSVALINEEALKSFNFDRAEEAINERLIFEDDTLVISGVVKNIHWNSLKTSYSPTLFVLDPLYNVYISLRINTRQLQASISHIKETYRSLFPNDPFEFFFLDQALNHQYQADIKFRNIFTVFSALAICIACIGLYGLVSFSYNLRVKEIGIRKVLGASMENLMVLLSKEYIYLIIIAVVLAIPIIYFGGKIWLNSYAFKVNPGMDLILLPALLLLVLSLITVSYRTYATASTNPTESLRNE